MKEQSRPPLICVRQVSLQYAGSLASGERPQALAGVDLDVFPGEWVAVVGANGSGKSTLVKLLCGLVLPDSGTVQVAGMRTDSPSDLPQLRRQVGMVWQNPDEQIVASVVEEEVAFGLEVRKISEAAMRPMVRSALMAAGLWELRERASHQLSGGQRQRLALAAALAPLPQCLVLDEATSMIDEAGKEELLRWLQQIRQSGTAIVSVTHDMREASLADRIVVLAEGQVVAQGTPKEIWELGDHLRAYGLTLPFTVDVSRQVHSKWPVFAAPLLVPGELLAECDRHLLQQASSKTESGGAGATGEWSPAPASAPGAPGHTAGTDTAPAIQAIELRNVSCTHQSGTPFAFTALTGIDWSVAYGERVVLLGRTGSGKSTLLQMLGGLLLADEGMVRIGGLQPQDRRDRKALRSVVGVCFQHPEQQLFERYVGDDIAYAPLRQGLSLDEARVRVKQAMAAMGLPFAWKDRPIYSLSGGQKRKVALAGILALQPQILVLDEPTAGLDPLAAAELLDYLQVYQEERSVTIVLVTHRLEEAASFAKRVTIMDAGKLVADGPLHTVFTTAELTRCGFPRTDFMEVRDGLADRNVTVPLRWPLASVAAQAILHKHFAASAPLQQDHLNLAVGGTGGEGT